MKILPTLVGGLCILPESEIDWDELQLICSDDDRPTYLAESLADLMDGDSEWGEYVVPDLEENFRNQTRFVDAPLNKHGKTTSQLFSFLLLKLSDGMVRSTR